MPTEETRETLVKSSEGDHTNGADHGMEKVENWVAQGDLDKSGNQVDGQMPRWDSSEKVESDVQIGSSTSDSQKIPTYGLKKKEKANGDASSVMGQQKQNRKEEGEVTSPIKPKTDFHDVGIIGHLDLGPNSDGQKRGKGRLKKLAREQGP